MKKALLLAPMGSVHRRFNAANISALRALGYEVHLAANFAVGDGTEKQNAEFVQQCADASIITHSIPYQRHSLTGALRQLKPTIALMRDQKYSVIHAHTETGGLILRLVQWATPKARCVYTPHGMSFYRGSSLKTQMLYRPLERWICSGMDVNIAINNEEFDVLRAWNRSSGFLVHGIGLNLEAIRNWRKKRDAVREDLGIPAQAMVVLSVGELDENKNHRIVLEALAGIKRDDVYYVICGVGPQAELLSRQAKKLGMGNRLILAGYRKDIPDIIHAADVFAFPSYHEGLPVALMEAMAGGLPVVCSDIRGNVDLITNAVNGFLASPADTEKWREKLGQLLNSSQFRVGFVAECQNEIRKYAMDNVVEALRVLYDGNRY